MLCFTCGAQRRGGGWLISILGVLHDHEQHSTLAQHMAGEEEAHMEKEAHVEKLGSRGGGWVVQG
jgi:hypothetical protein